MATPVVAGGLEATGPPRPTLGPTTEPTLLGPTTEPQEAGLQPAGGPSQVDVLGHGAAFIITEINEAGPRRRRSYSRFPADDDRSSKIRPIRTAHKSVEWLDDSLRPTALVPVYRATLYVLHL
jgi:hypothetical protein